MARQFVTLSARTVFPRNSGRCTHTNAVCKSEVSTASAVWLAPRMSSHRNCAPINQTGHTHTQTGREIFVMFPQILTSDCVKCDAWTFRVNSRTPSVTTQIIVSSCTGEKSDLSWIYALLMVYVFQDDWYRGFVWTGATQTHNMPTTISSPNDEHNHWIKIISFSSAALYQSSDTQNSDLHC